MWFVKALSASSALLTVCVALPTSGSNHKFKRSIVEKFEEAPNGWTKDASVDIDKDETTVTLRIHLANQGMDEFHAHAMNIATPGHKNYGQHLSHAEIMAMIAPKQESTDLVREWLASEIPSNEADIEFQGDYVVVQASVNTIEDLLSADYTTFVHDGTSERKLRTLTYSLPEILDGHVDLVQPTTFFGLRPQRSTISGVHELTDEPKEERVTGCSGSSITPKCLANLYSFANAKPQSSGLLGIAGFLEQYAIPSDYKTFLNQYAYFSNKNKTFTCTGVNGGSCSNSTAGTEANLDVQYAGSISSNVPNTYYSTGGRPPFNGTGDNTNEPYLDFLNYLLALPDDELPNTLSISYGDDEATVPLDYATNACNLFSQLGARGVSILVSAGDSGVGTTCQVNGQSQFTTSFPAGCPWVTTVGGTTGNLPENAWEDGGGGFSEVFGRPSYQDSAVQNWLSNDQTHSSVSQYFNSSGRAYPDISAQATGFEVVIDGSAQGVDGTSCSAPTVAGIIQLLNSGRIAAGKKGLGFLNPWIYGTASSGFTDITNGGITGCGGSIDNAGFSAVSGWDPATGFGTPNYSKLLGFASN